MADQGGLSDALRRMAESRPAPAAPDDTELPQARMPGENEPAADGKDANARDAGVAGSAQPDTPGAAQDHVESGAGAHAEDSLMPAHETGGDNAWTAPTSEPEAPHAFLAGPQSEAAASPPAPSPSPAPGPVAHDHLKVAAVPVLGVVGALLLVPATWALLLLLGIEFWTARTPEALTMAWIMLVCWPIALVLLVSAGVIFRQLRRGH